MEVALTLESLNKKISNKYDYDEKRIVGIMLARYDIAAVRNIINDCYIYWHHNTGKYLDFFWAGYGAYLCDSEQTSTKIILNFNGNQDRAYFDLEAFITIKNKLNSKLKKQYKDRIQLVLLNYANGKLHFDQSFQIDLEENLDENYTSIREIVEWITNECHSCHDVASLIVKLKSNDIWKKIKGISCTDIIKIILNFFKIVYFKSSIFFTL